MGEGEVRGEGERDGEGVGDEDGEVEGVGQTAIVRRSSEHSRMRRELLGGGATDAGAICGSTSITAL